MQTRTPPRTFTPPRKLPRLKVTYPLAGGEHSTHYLRWGEPMPTSDEVEADVCAVLHAELPSDVLHSPSTTLTVCNLRPTIEPDGELQRNLNAT